MSDTPLIIGLVVIGVILLGSTIYFLAPGGDSINLDSENPYNDDVVVYWFWSETCPICHEQMDFIEGLDDKENVSVVELEVSDNMEVYNEMLDTYEVESSGTPMTVVDDSVIIGDSPAIRSDITNEVDACEESDEPCYPKIDHRDYN